MNICPKCGKVLPESARFCDGCGSAVPTGTGSGSTAPKAPICANCGKPLVPGTAFCASCGAPVSQSQNVTPIRRTRDKKGFSVPNIDLKSIKKPYLIGGIAAIVAVIAIIIIIVVAVSASGGSKPEFAMYVKDGELYYSTLGKKDAQEIASDVPDSSSSLRYAIEITDDGSKIFYPDKLESYDTSFSLYWRSLKKNTDAQKIDSDITSYTVNQKGTLVTYLKSSGALYQHNLKEKEKVASDVSSYYVSEDGKTIIYRDTDGNIYRKLQNKDAEKLESNTDSLVSCSDDFTTIWYLKSESLYERNVKSDKEKIASDVYNVLKIYDSGEIYYLTYDTEEIPYSDFFVDDVDTSDMGWYEQDWFNSLREYIQNNEYTQTTYSLYYYNGKEPTLISSSCKSSASYAMENTIVLFRTLETDIQKTKLSTLSYDDYYYYSSAVEDAINEALSSDITYNIAFGSQATALELDDPWSVSLSSDGKYIYYIADIDEDDSTGTLYKAAISGKSVKAAEEIDSDVYRSRTTYSNGHFIYFKDVDDNSGDLYLDGTLVSYDAYTYDYTYNSGTGKLVYYSDIDDDESAGTLNVYSGKKSTKVSDDVYDFVVTADGNIVYLKDYSTKHDTGDLYLYNGKDSKLLDEDVSMIVKYVSTSRRWYY